MVSRNMLDTQRNTCVFLAMPFFAAPKVTRRNFLYDHRKVDISPVLIHIEPCALIASRLQTLRQLWQLKKTRAQSHRARGELPFPATALNLLILSSFRP